VRGAARHFIDAATPYNDVRVRLFLEPFVVFVLAYSGPAQADRPLIITNKTDAPLHITEAHCGQHAHGTYCQATLQFADSKETWDGYGLLWTVTLDDGSKSPFRQSADRSIEPSGRPDGSFQPTGRFYKPGDIVNAGGKGIASSKTDRNGKPLHIAYAQVEVEFVMNRDGTVWGDSKSPTYLEMVANRKKVKEGTQ
jgi:hypothetical protein